MHDSCMTQEKWPIWNLLSKSFISEGVTLFKKCDYKTASKITWYMETIQSLKGSSSKNLKPTRFKLLKLQQQQKIPNFAMYIHIILTLTSWLPQVLCKHIVHAVKALLIPHNTMYSIIADIRICRQAYVYWQSNTKAIFYYKQAFI